MIVKNNPKIRKVSDSTGNNSNIKQISGPLDLIDKKEKQKRKVTFALNSAIE